MRFWKGHALGNDYIVLDTSGPGAPAPAVVRALCDRHRGVGADGVLAADPVRDPVALRIFNPDGGEAEKSGNGLRILGAWLRDTGRVGEAPFRVALPAETVEMRVLSTRAGVHTLRVDMGTPSFRAGDIPFTDAAPDAEVSGRSLAVAGTPLGIHLVSVGNPHCVVFLDELDDAVFRRLAPALQARPAFAEGVNVQFARLVDERTVDIRIWERGAGETLASGSSACAVAAAAHRSGRTEARSLRVRMPGGVVTVERDDDGRLHLTGEAVIVFEGEVAEAVVAAWREGRHEGRREDRREDRFEPT
ncbi:MAG: diaminopimelate epimerase [Candidatus Longimicrobiales bacterium M2_2A_002]